MFKSTMTAKKRNKSTYSARRTSFTSLPDDVALNCLARISAIHYPALSLVSKGFRSLIASRKLYDTRSCNGQTETFLYVCLDLKVTNHNPRWFLLHPIPEQQKLLPITWSPPHQHPKSSAVVSIGSEIYIFGGSLKKKESKKALVLDCRSHQWRTLPEMSIPRVSAAVDVIDGKIYVVGGSKCNRPGEIYDPESQTWEIISPTILDHLTIQKSRLVIDQTVYDKNGVKRMICLVEIENVLCQVSVSNGNLVWYNPKENLWCGVRGLYHLIFEEVYLISVTNSGGGRRRVIVWWESVVKSRNGKGRHGTKELKTDIWCAEIWFERRDDVEELWGFVEWYKNVYTIYGCYYRSPLVLHSAIVSL